VDRSGEVADGAAELSLLQAGRRAPNMSTSNAAEVAERVKNGVPVMGFLQAPSRTGSGERIGGFVQFLVPRGFSGADSQEQAMARCPMFT